ncbi:hypothetical protein [Massilia glaciei]|uniref:Uncharacterized protein n=1 Tax=Massilia glaciei TaxID=1524097 RepID=A0A2U2HIS9_9BURK|nr:hypothetical protein [Massilia glaciei]PWF46687.1 hypothetical protein C7C56_015710 [Massilia glaciei]
MTTQLPPDTPAGAPFAALRAQLATHAAPPRVEQALMTAFAKQRRPRRWHHALSARHWGMAGGLGACMMALLVFTLAPTAPSAPGAAPLPMIDDDDGGAFLALAPLERIEREAAPQMVEADLSGAALASLGVALTPETAGDTVRAEMLVSAEGQPLALRLVSQQSAVQ